MVHLVAGVCALALVGAAPPGKQYGEMPGELKGEANVASADLSELRSAVLTHTLVLAALLALACFAVWYVLVRANKTWDESPRSAQLFGLVFIVGVSALLLSVGFSGSQLAAITGILGTALGYLFGKQSNDAAAPTSAPAPAQTPPAGRVP